MVADGLHTLKSAKLEIRPQDQLGARPPPSTELQTRLVAEDLEQIQRQAKVGALPGGGRGCLRLAQDARAMVLVSDVKVYDELRVVDKRSMLSVSGRHSLHAPLATGNRQRQRKARSKQTTHTAEKAPQTHGYEATAARLAGPRQNTRTCIDQRIRLTSPCLSIQTHTPFW